MNIIVICGYSLSQGEEILSQKSQESETEDDQESQLPAEEPGEVQYEFLLCIILGRKSRASSTECMEVIVGMYSGCVTYGAGVVCG